ncbi:HET-domain-containing protein [Glonium stellatum]|uniref:HET-domain-containing protein n=1 Tax=Glonium stellatum TaxID=574774 RepID=A0A8E2JYI9_9PEZI|nr:HET-domain-containing protein [Glonium stellatum]
MAKFHFSRLRHELHSIFLNNWFLEDNQSLPTIGSASYFVEENSSSIQCHRQVKSWLEDCLENHSSCSSQDDCALPTRVVNVGLISDDDLKYQQPFLFEPSGASGRYVALSYCWGKNANTVTTTSETFQAHKQCIEMDSLPKTIQDAITITRSLRIPYIWIDALCIIQGDPSDWAREAGKMCHVYSSAVLTISASNASSSNEGIFGPQRFGAPPRPLSYCGNTVYVCQNVAREHNRFEVQMRMREPMPLNRRAWTLQEGVLSNRIVHYTSSELVWECNDRFLCECGFANMKIEMGDEISNRSIRQPELAREMKIDRKIAYQKWRDLVMVFMERQISVDDDRLAAFSGLARQFRRLLRAASGGAGSDQYIAGLWAGDLAHGMLWSVEDDWFRQSRDLEIEYRRPKSWRAPSWSWAAFEGPVEYAPLTRLESMIDVVEAEALPRTMYDEMGQVTSARLILNGTYCPGTNAMRSLCYFQHHPTSKWHLGVISLSSSLSWEY